MNFRPEWDDVMESSKTQKANQRRFFAVASLGKDRWYWVVWPSLDQSQSGQPTNSTVSGYEKSKAEAVDQALTYAGIDGEWVAAKYAKQYHKFARGNRKNQEPRGATDNAPTVRKFLFRDNQNPDTDTWYSVPHRIVNETNLFVYVEQRGYDANNLTGSWLDHGAATYRLNRKSLDQNGYAFAPISADTDDPLFFVTPIANRVTHSTDRAYACLAHLNLSYPSTAAEMKAAYRRAAKHTHPDLGGDKDEFLALRAAYELALRLCRE